VRFLWSVNFTGREVEDPTSRKGSDVMIARIEHRGRLRTKSTLPMYSSTSLLVCRLSLRHRIVSLGDRWRLSRLSVSLNQLHPALCINDQY